VGVFVNAGGVVAASEEKEPEEARPAADLLPAAYDELRRLAGALTQQLRPGQTLQATARGWRRWRDS
jgi:hypothetical protein